MNRFLWPWLVRVWSHASILQALITLCIGLAQTRIEAGQLQGAYLLLVLGLAIVGGTAPAVLASVLAFLAFDWYFVRPIHSFSTSEPEEWFALALFLVVSISVGSLTARLKESAANARRHSAETSALYEISSATLSGARLGGILQMIVEQLATRLGLQSAAVFLFTADGDLVLSACSQVAPALRRAIERDPGPREFLAGRANAAAGSSAGSSSMWRIRPDLGSVALQAIGVPLTLDERSFGVLAAYLSVNSATLTGEARHLLDAFAAQTVLAVGRDRLLQEEARARSAEESDRLKSTFLASISHDLRTPITAIKTEVGLLRSAPEAGAAAAAMDNLDGELDRLNRLVGDLLELSRIEGGGLILRRQNQDVADLIGAAVRRVEPLLNGHLLELDAGDDPPQLALDGPQISRVFTNLLENAIKFSPPCSAIGIRVSSNGNDVLIRVHNAGPPIAPAEQRRIFDKFHHLHSGNPGSGGTGLGLAICKGIVEAHGGQIWTRNEDAGVAFYVRLPRAPHVAAATPGLKAAGR
jgi:two-component system, OmpR family, sensor histidine kinase KdpD